MTGASGFLVAGPRVRTRPGTWISAGTGIGESVVRVRPGGGLLGIGASRSHPLGELSKLVAAALADGRERHGVPGKVERYLVWLARTVATRHGLN